jgi:hypothetical protein
MDESFDLLIVQSIWLVERLSFDVSEEQNRGNTQDSENPQPVEHRRLLEMVIYAWGLRDQ